ncbi:hypothetical protein Btru_013408 [Bulinus truncatus]|nr:hypothetical protein Btru_013408 [Bulinus truncatus]
MEDEKYPKPISNVQITDIKQIISIFPCTLNVARSDCSTETFKSDPTVVDFLTNLGASLFAQASTNRSLSYRLQSFTNLGAGRSSSLSETDAAPVETHLRDKTSKKKDAKRLKAVHVAPYVTSMPSHKIQLKPDFQDSRQYEKLQNGPRDALILEKRYEVFKEHEKLRQQRMKRAMLRAELKNNISHRIMKEARLWEKATNEMTRWTLHGRAARISNLPIIIVGAGLAGLVAAHQLLNAGFNCVTVLEASDRLGGRIHSVYLQDSSTVLEMGVVGIDTPADNKEIYKMASSCGLTEGSYIEPRLKCEILGDKNTKIYARATRLSKLIDKDVQLLSQLTPDGKCITPINLSYDSYVAERHRRLARNSHSKSASKSALLRSLKSLSDCSKYYIGDNLGDSAVQWLSGPIQKSKMILPIGISAIINVLTDRLKSHTVRRGCLVNLIEWNYADRRLAPDSRNVRISCSSGEVFTARHVILAIPLGHLKETADRLFVPSLPVSKRGAIQKMGFGTVCKAFFLYSSPLKSNAISLVVSKNTSHFEGTLHIKSVSDKILEITSVGSCLESMTEEKLAQEVTQIMRDNFSSKIPEPVRVYKSTWFNDPLFRGSHPYLTVHCDQNSIRELGKPIFSQSGIPLLLFAGDYTHEDLGCPLEAAFCSGLREAQRLENIYDEYFGSENVND